MKRLALGIVLAASLAVFSSAQAFAAKPANQACLGKDMSGYAEGGSGFGGFVAGLAATTTGVGGEIQAHLAGQVPDSTMPNTCND
jgi:hypothetical protein